MLTPERLALYISEYCAKNGWPVPAGGFDDYDLTQAPITILRQVSRDLDELYRDDPYET